MLNFDKFLLFFPRSALNNYLKSKESRQLFFKELNFINFLRLRAIVFIAIILCVVMLVIDFTSTNVWDSFTIKKFILFDFIYLIILLVSLVFILIKSPIKSTDVKPVHNAIFKLLVVASIVWISLISAIESFTANSLSSFVIGVFVLSTVFIHRGKFLALILFIGLATLICCLLYYGFTPLQLTRQYFPLFFLIIIAYTTSQLLYINNIRAFAANYNLERANTNLDELVKIRTFELSQSNERLKHEIIEREKYEAQLKKAKERAEEADRLKSSFLANMSHEIRTPLNGIIGFSDLMQIPNLTYEKLLHYGSIVKKNSYQLLKIIDDIIDISMIESNQLKYAMAIVDVKDILSVTMDMFKAGGDFDTKKIEFSSINLIPGGSLEICTDQFRIQQVINNLVSNALKFTEKGYVHLAARQDSDEVLFYVEDTGIGIPPDKSEIIFERFRQIDDSLTRSYGGTGLGLSISSAIINTLNGIIWLDHSYKNGSRFCFTLPVERPALKKVTTDKKRIIKKYLSSKSVLIFSDDDSYFKYLTKFFEGSEINRLTASGIQPKNDYIKSADLIITVPQTDLNFYENLKSALYTKKNRFTLFSIVDNTNEMEKSKSAGSNFCYLNPLNISRFIKDVNNVISQRV